ncbi:MAG: polyribonucleotide nucleotidyltransferase [Bacteroidetes bacterium]|nr:polyribonucleotide nucleotidyltransferase [Bacteroidia bacterium]PCH68530.1 MAG: polyribonucleotide nucleotidyltransferase [Bacteroidota bacterium]
MSNLGITKTFDIGDGRTISIETGKLAKQAHGSVVVRMGNTMLLATVVSNQEPREGFDFFPLTVDYQEKYAAAGRFPGGFLKREARLSDYEVLVCRLVDRALRPMFPKNYLNETQIAISLISADTSVPADALAALAASSALAVSDIPFNGPISEVRIAKVDGKLIVNPTKEEIEKADLELIIAADADNIMMVEGEMDECSEADIIDALKVAHEAIKIQCKAQVELAQEFGATTKREVLPQEEDEELKARIATECRDKIYEVAKSGNPSKSGRKESFKAIKTAFEESFSEEELEEKGDFINTYFHDLEKEEIRKMMINDRVRLDGRKLDEIRPIWTEVDYIPSAHGSAIFTRGETQSLTTVTLGDKSNEQMIDAATYKGTSKFLLHYNFPAFSTGEVKPNRGVSRREVGHGNLAMRSLKRVLPEGEDNPYTIRVVSDILESNGSSSMATVCAGSMALMDAGIKTKAAVSGIAMGLIMNEETGKYAVLSDILGDEDHLGDMDFKVTGTEKGIMACQMDIKVNGLSYEVMAEALQQASAGRLHILNEMAKTLSEAKPDLKPHAPRIVKIIIPKDFIGAVIGPGGKMVQQIQADFNVDVWIEEVEDSGIVSISSSNKDDINAAVAMVNGITAMPEVGEVYKGKVKSIKPFGAFVEFLPGKDGLLHISEISWERIEKIEDVMKEGDEFEVKLVEIDRKTGKFRLSKKVLTPREKPDQQNSDNNNQEEVATNVSEREAT